MIKPWSYHPTFLLSHNNVNELEYVLCGMALLNPHVFAEPGPSDTRVRGGAEALARGGVSLPAGA